MSNYSDSDPDSDNDAPEIITLASSKKNIKQLNKKEKLIEAEVAQSKKAKTRAADARLKVAAKGKAKQKELTLEEALGEVAEEEEAEVVQMVSEDEVEDEEEETAASTSNYLDPSLFASAAEAYSIEEEKNAPAASGMGKHKLKRMVRAQKQARAAAALERANQVGEGGARQVGGKTLQHLPAISAIAPNLSSTTLRPSHSSATKFLTTRLYSKKRTIAVLDAGHANHQAPSERKKQKGAMSDMSKYLMGLGPDPELKQEGDKAGKKRSLLLQAQGMRKPATARKLSSTSGKAVPARDFAASLNRR